MFDTDKFIELIKDYNVLWDKKLPEYSDRTVRDRAWLTVAEQFYSDWEEVDAKTKDTRAKEMKSKWRNIRDSFFRAMGSGKSGDPASKKKKYVHSEQLMFLISATDKRQTTGNITSDTEPTEATAQIDEEYNEDSIDDPSPVTSPPATATSRTCSPSPRPKPSACYKKKSQQLTAFQSVLLKKIDENQGKMQQEEPDADKMFLLSLLPNYKQLTEEDKFDFKIMNLEFLRERTRKKQSPSGPITAHYGQQTFTTLTSAREMSPFYRSERNIGLHPPDHENATASTYTIPSPYGPY